MTNGLLQEYTTILHDKNRRTLHAFILEARKWRFGALDVHRPTILSRQQTPQFLPKLNLQKSYE